jgi:hypothetical protein
MEIEKKVEESRLKAQAASNLAVAFFAGGVVTCLIPMILLIGVEKKVPFVQIVGLAFLVVLCVIASNFYMKFALKQIARMVEYKNNGG